MSPRTKLLLPLLTLLLSLLGALPAHALPPDPREVPTLGPATAKVTIIQISDFQCPYCSRTFVTMQELRKIYGDELRFVFVNLPLPFHQNAQPAAVAAMAAHQQGKFWEMQEKLFQHFGALSEANYTVWAQELHLDMTQVAKDLEDPQTAARVDRDAAVAAALNVRGTPGFFVNGVLVAGAQPLATFKEVIDAQLTQANDLLKAGATLGADLHAKALKANNPALADNILRLVFGHDTPPEDVAPPEPAKPARDDKTLWRVTVRGDEPFVGPADALVTLVEFVDYQCPFCGKYNQELMAFQKAHAGQVRIVFKNFPLSFHANAQGAAEVAMCAHAQGKYAAVAEHIYANQGSLEIAALEPAVVALGVASGPLAACLRQHKAAKAIDLDKDEAAKVAVTGTPSLYFQGRKLVNGRGTEVLEALLTEELPKAEALIQQGIPAKQVYAQTVAGGKVFTPPPALDARGAQLHNSGSPVLGDRKAKTQVTVFVDMQCPYSAKILPLVKDLNKRMNGKIGIVMRHFPLSNQCNPQMSRDMHPAACLAAQWSIAADAQGKFWPFVTRVLENYVSLMPKEGDIEERRAAENDTLASWAKEVGMDVKRAADFVAQGRFETQLTADLEDAKDATVRGTPSFYFNGRAYNGAMTAEAMEKAVKQLQAGTLK